MTIVLNSLIPELSVSNFAKSLAFYVDVLGFSISYQRKNEGFAFLILGDAQIMIDTVNMGRTWKTGKLNYPLGRGVNFQIKVDSITPLIEKLKINHIDLFLNVEEKWYQTESSEIGQKQFLVMDPDGYLLRFVEFIK